ncbi:sensor histidine kinase [Corynebacterium liangguodongii]|uniref:Sensor histidine kinase n=1 Tax=Corynebacterium liangguodongii TaxID=2079535 RepID=A0A2S0WGH3_9CORY|nr:sensor histidine kinase [Corynebacterium liangguodongii]AWB84877.1 sensor histidine kinase [Corynebacterium liangguodongii]PWB99260.1 sensor histidine kinase [Corynebacterium liangguodongii]
MGTTVAGRTGTGGTGNATGNKALDTGITVLSVSLLVISLAALVRMPLNSALLHIVLVSLFSFLLFYGIVEMPKWGRVGQASWLMCLTGLWIAEMMVTPLAIYWVFILFFVYLRTFNDWRGVVWVALGLAIAVGAQIPTGLTVGGVVGPVLSALVVMATNYAFSTIDRVSKEREALIDELLAARQQLAATEREAGVAQERERLAHEIHDTVAQGLSSIQMLLHAADRDLDATGLSPAELAPVKARMDTARRAAANNLAETRAMIAALTPAPLTEASLLHALERVARDFSQASGIAIEVSSDGAPRVMPMRCEAGVLRIAQGAVSNAVKHSGASKIRVTLTYAPAEVRLDVVDNGRGFDPESLAEAPTGLGHVGLAAMRSRAEELGGELVVESGPGGPTAVSVALPGTLGADDSQVKEAGV